MSFGKATELGLVANNDVNIRQQVHDALVEGLHDELCRQIHERHLAWLQACLADIFGGSRTDGQKEALWQMIRLIN